MSDTPRPEDHGLALRARRTREPYVILTRAQRYSRARTDVFRVDERTGKGTSVQALSDERSPRIPGLRTMPTGIRRDTKGRPELQMGMTLEGQSLVRNLVGWREPDQPSMVDFFGDRSREAWFPIPGSSLRLGTHGTISMLRAGALAGLEKQR